MHCFVYTTIGLPFLSSRCIQFLSSSRPQRILREFHWNHITSYSQPTRRFQYVGTQNSLRLFLPRWYPMNWCAADVTRRGGRIHCGVNIFLLPLHPPHHSPYLLFSRSVLSTGSVRAGLLRPLRVRRVFKLYCSWQAWGKTIMIGDCIRQNKRMSREKGLYLHAKC